MKIFNSLILILISSSYLLAQDGTHEHHKTYLDKKWKTVATKMPTEWYGTDEAKQVAENVLLCQRDVGGWEKNIDYHKLSETEKADLIKDKKKPGATIDNGSTTMEMRFLARVYAHFGDERYKKAFEKGLNYLFEAQYKNGGWPQFFPARNSKSASYSSHITYNDNAMVNVMNLLKGIAEGDGEFASLHLGNEIKEKAKQSFDNGVDCILKTQIVVDGKPTVWCAQHDEVTLAPANARAFELASFSGAESADIVLLLMKIDNPSPAIISSINGAVTWFEANKLEGIKTEKVDQDGKKNLVVVEDKTAPPIWARFYDLETGKPFFCDRDGIKKYSVSEIGYERRNGYGWYTYEPAKVLKKYGDWKKKWHV